jgi:ubiquitin C-terminal hydrolase
MFGLRNKSGSCWVNAALQALFRIPELQTRFSEDEHDKSNPVETSMCEIWASKGDEGLKDFYECVKTATMPAGENIGDSHELIQYICDKIPFLDKMFRFKIGNQIRCKNCPYVDVRRESLIEFPITGDGRKEISVTDAILRAVSPYAIDDWKCEKCSQKGCTKQFLIETLPQVLMFHQTALDSNVTYTAVLGVNGVKYMLLAVVCFNGGHWWTYGRNPPPGNPWYELNDMTVRSFHGNAFPLDRTMRLLIYYRLNE